MSLIIVAFLVLITATVIVVAYSVLITDETLMGGIELKQQQALYIAEAGIERAMEFLEDDTDWSDNNGSAVIAESFGEGSYSVDLSAGTRTTIVVESEAALDSGRLQVRRKIRQKIRRLPEAFNYALFSDTANSSRIQGTLVVNGGDIYARGDITDGPLNVADGGTIATTTGGLVYSEGAVSATGTYTVGTTPAHTPPKPVLDTTYFGDILADFNSDMNTYDTSADYLGYAGVLEPDPNGVVNIVLSGNRYFSNFRVRGSSTITGTGAIVSDDLIRLQQDTVVTPSGGDILLIARNNATAEDRSILNANTVLYSSTGLARAINQSVVNDSTLLSSGGIRILNQADLSDSTLYQSDTTDTLQVNGGNVLLTSCTLLSSGGMRIDNPDILSGSILYSTATADRIDINGANTLIEGSVLANSQFRLTNNAVITGLIYAVESDMRRGIINGSVATDSFFNDEIVNGASTVTINYDQSYLPEAPAGLGLDIDADGNEEGIVIKVPGTWRQL